MDRGIHQTLEEPDLLGATSGPGLRRARGCAPLSSLPLPLLALMQ